MTTSRATFDVAPQGSLVRRMFGTDAEASWAPVQLPDGSYFVDLNPRWFEAVLDVLRHGQSALSATKPEDRAGAACVADYLGIDLDAQPSAMEPPRQRQLPTTTTVIVAGPGALGQCTRDLWDATEMRATQTTYVKRIEVQTGLTLCALRDALADAAGLCAGTLVAHMCRRRVNNTLRPDVRLPLDSTTLTLRDAYYGSKPVVVLVHDASWFPKASHLSRACPVAQSPDERAASCTALAQPSGAILVFVRHFDRDAEALSAPRPMVVDPSVRVFDALSDMCHAVGVHRPDGGVPLVFEEVVEDMVIRVNCDGTFCDAEIGYGDLLWIEWSTSLGFDPDCIDDDLLARITVIAD